MQFVTSEQLFMTDILPNIRLSRLFSNRIKNYLLFLQVTNNIELICQITDYLSIQGILNFLTTCKHIYSFSKIQTIEIRLLKAKIDYYERPKIQPNFQIFINLLQIKVPLPQTKLKSQKLAQDFECLKKINQQIWQIKGIKKSSNQQQVNKLQKSELSTSKQTNINRIQQMVKNQKPSKNNSYPNKNHTKQIDPKIQKMIKNTLSSHKKKQLQSNNIDYYQRFQEIEYNLAKQDFQRRKKKRLQQHRQKEQFMTIQELKKMAVQDPSVRNIVKKIEKQETQKIQRANRDNLKIKPIKINKNEIQRLRQLQQQQKQKIVVVRQSIAQKLYTNIRSFMLKS